MVFTKDVFDLQEKSDADVVDFLQQEHIGLTLDEAKQLQFEILGRAPSLAEFILFGIEGSEHCSYKSSRPHLKQFMTEGERVVLAVKEDAGVIRAAEDEDGKQYCIVMSHESHNHPSQVVPYEGAATGIGGNVRDVCCMGAEVIALADDLRFGSLDEPRTKWIYEGVVSGIAGYGNPIGVPNLAGGVQFDSGYQENCLVTVTSLGIVQEDRVLHSYAPDNADGFDIILAGKPTDNSGFGGASFASFELEEEKRELNKGAVQEPNAFLGRHMIKASTELAGKLAREGLLDKVGFKDLGAGGIACAGVELAEAGGFGAEISIDAVHTAVSGLPPQVILCAETQERYMWISHPGVSPMILEHYNEVFALPSVSRGAEARVIGKITKKPQFIVSSGDEIIVDAPASEVTKGFLYHRPYKAPEVSQGLQHFIQPSLPEGYDLTKILRQLLAHENIASKAPVYDSYDKQVQGRTVVDAGDSDCGIMAPFNSSAYPEEIRQVGITLSTDQNPRQNRVDAYQGAVNAVVEAYCNTAAAGAKPIAFSDCLCYGNPEKPEQMYQFVRGTKGVADACRSLNVPIIAGNVSLYNESRGGAIPPSPMIACLGRLDDAEKHSVQSFQAPGEAIFILGLRDGRCGGSIYHEIISGTKDPADVNGKKNRAAGSRRTGDREYVPPETLPAPDLAEIVAWGDYIREIVGRGLCSTVHDISEGGLAAALCEMSFANDIGFDISLPASAIRTPQGSPAPHPSQTSQPLEASQASQGSHGSQVRQESQPLEGSPPEIDAVLFCETPGFVLSIPPENRSEVLQTAENLGQQLIELGRTVDSGDISIKPADTDGQQIRISVQEAKTLWQEGLRNKLL